MRWYARRARGTYTVSYVARATTAGRLVRVPALAGRTDGNTLVVSDTMSRR